MGYETYPVRKESVSDGNSSSRSIGYAIPAVWFLGNGPSDVVVPVKRVESGELHPAVAQFLIGVTVYRGCINSTAQTMEHFDLLKPQVSAPTKGIWNNWNWRTP